jgi:glycosyltransferase involved in cell wall biosynthesis
VIVRGCGSAPEVVTHGKTGFVCENKLDFIHAIHNIGQISRKACRAEFEQRFSRDCMVENYERLYFSLLRQKSQLTMPFPSEVYQRATA